MLNFKLLAATLAVCQGFNIPLPNDQAVLDIDIHINTNSHDGMPMNSDAMGMHLSDVSKNTYGMEMESEDMPMHTDATAAQWNRGLVAATSVEPWNAFVVAAVGSDLQAYITMANDTWFPSYKGYTPLGGRFNRSLAVSSFKGTVYITGTTESGNLVLKNYAQNGLLYPKTKSWILLAEGIADGTPAIASHDNKTISIVARSKDGSLIHKIYTPETDGQDDATIPNKKFASNPALIVRPDGKLQVYATDASGQMHFSEWKSGTTWTAWTPLGGDFVGDPATKWLGVKGDVWSVGKDGNVYARYFTDKDCFSATWISIAGTKCLNTGSLHYWGDNYQFADFFCQTAGSITMIRRDGDKMTPSAIGGVTYAAPAAFDLHWKGTRYSDLMVIGMDSSLFRKQRTGESWAAWEQLSGKFQA